MTGRRIDAFFYGLFMDVDVQREAGVAPLDPRRAFDGFALRIGQRATLGPSAGARAYGMLFALTHSEIERLYAGQVSTSTAPRPSSPGPWRGRRRRPCASTCAKRRDRTSGRVTAAVALLGGVPMYVHGYLIVFRGSRLF